jgi:hypothetical protein
MATDFQKECYLSKTGLIVTNENGLAKDLLTIIRNGVEDNDLLRDRLYPQSKEGWGKEELTMKNGVNIKAKSSGSKLRGGHPFWIVLDDFLNDSSLYSQEQREKYINTVKGVILPMPPKNGQIIVVGTPYHQDDMYSGFLKLPESGFKAFEYPAVFPDGTILWDSRYSLEDILATKASLGSLIFSREILCKPVSEDSSLFPFDIIEKCYTDRFKLINNNYSLPQKFKGIYLGCDFAFSANVAADFSVFLTIGVDDYDNFWILNIHRSKGKSFAEQMSIIKGLHRSFNYNLIIMESVQAQSIYPQEAAKAGLPVKGHATSAKSKYSEDIGLPSLQVHFEQQKIKIPRGDEKSRDMTDILQQELSSMAYTPKGIQGTGSHDDTVMALLFAIMAAQQGGGFDFAFI